MKLNYISISHGPMIKAIYAINSQNNINKFLVHSICRPSAQTKKPLPPKHSTHIQPCHRRVSRPGTGTDKYRVCQLLRQQHKTWRTQQKMTRHRRQSN